MVKHQVELRLPRLFGKKKDGEDDKPEVTTKVFIDEEIKEIPLPVLLGTTAIVSITIGYLVGFRNGVIRGGNTYNVFKD